MDIKITLKDIIRLIDDEYYIKLYLGDTSKIAIVLEGCCEMIKKVETYHDNEVSSINIGTNSKTNEPYFYILLE